MKRPLGKRITEICEALEKHGTATSATLRKSVPHIKDSDLCKYCYRAEELNLLTIERGLFSKYTIRQNWRQVAESRSSGECDVPGLSTRHWAGISSVFAMGALQ